MSNASQQQGRRLGRLSESRFLLAGAAAAALATGFLSAAPAHAAVIVPAIADAEIRESQPEFTRGAPGSGLGLAMVRGVAEAHGEEVTAERADGGGTLIRPENRQMVREWAEKIIYLRCSPERLLERIQSDPMSRLTRPSLTSLGGGIEEISKVLADREPIYRQMMDAELEVTYLTPDEAMVYIVRLL